VASYVEARGVPSVWFQVDADDSDPAAFFHYLTQGLGAARKHLQALPQLAPEHLKDLSAFARRYFRSFFARLAPPAVLVLDNFQEADDALVGLLGHAVNEVPHGLNVVAISRTDPAAALSELDARGLLTQLGAGELALTLEETRAMAARRGVEEDWIVRAMHDQSAGWPAGVTLMLERLKRTGYRGGKMPANSREGVFNYFANLIFDKAPKGVQQALLSLAYLPRMTATMAIEMSGDPDAGKLLESLHRRQLFTDRRTGSEPVYQFHALFREFLVARLTALATPDPTLKQLERSANVLIRHGDWEPAFELFVQARAWKDARRLLRDHAQKLIDAGRCQTIVRWAHLLPEEERSRDTWLHYWLACALAQIDPNAAVRAFASARSEFKQRGEHLGAVLSGAGVLQVCSLDHSDYGRVEALLNELSREVQHSALLTEDDELFVLGVLVWSAFFVVPWHTCLVGGLDRIQALLQRVSSVRVCLPAAISALTVASQSGDMERSRTLREKVASMVHAEEASPLLACWGLFQVAHSFFLEARYEDALQHFDAIWSLAEGHDLRKVLTAALMHRFMLDFRLSDLRKAEATMLRIEGLPAPHNDYARALGNNPPAKPGAFLM
jgi:ATP/maltotriose-dependent transcriptional regulator MalT